MNFNSEQYSVVDIKKMFNLLDNVNFFGDFTLQDVESVKKKLYMYYRNQYPMRDEQIKTLLDVLAKKLIEEKFSLSLEKPQNVLVKNTVKDDLNPNYKNTISRITEIDSQYRPTLFQCNYPENCKIPSLSPASETMFSSKLTDTLNNMVSLKVSNLSIPFSFYNIELSQSNSFFSVDLSGEGDVICSDGYYNITSFISGINNSTISDYEGTHYTDNSAISHHFVFSYNSTSGKTTITNNESFDITLTFYDNKTTLFRETNVNHSLGWILGFRQISCVDDHIYSTYVISANSSITSEYITYIPVLKYFVITADDHNHNQSNKSLIQLNQGKEYIKPTPYYKNVNDGVGTYSRSHDTPYYSNSHSSRAEINTSINNDISGEICLQTMSTSDLKPWTNQYDNRQLTRKQLYSNAAINTTNQETQLKIQQQTMSNILAIIPFESKSLEWGKSIFFSDKNQYAREYHGPVDIEKLTIKVYDDKGHILNLNGQDWSMTLISKHLYKY